MSRCARKSKPPLIASEMTAIAAPTTVRPGSCVHLSPIGQPISHSPATIRYAQAIATSRARSLCDSRNHSQGRFQIRDSGTPVRGQARGGGAGSGRIHQTLRVTPAMAAGVTDRLWEMKDMVEMLEAFETARNRAA